MADTVVQEPKAPESNQNQTQNNQNQNPKDPNQSNQNNQNDSGSGDYESDEQRLLRYQTSLEVAVTDSPIQTKLAEYGYNTAKLTDMKDNVVKINGLFANKNKVHGVQLAASQDVGNKFVDADKSYKITLEVARQTFKNDPNASSSLLLRGRRKRTMSGWKMQTETFYTNILSTPAFMEAMAEFGYNESKLSAELKKVQDVIAADITHKKNFGDSVEATAKRDAELDELEEKMSKFYSIASAVFADNPQTREKLGIK